MGIDSFNMRGRAALITGGSKGLGRAMALTLASAGADVVVTSRHLAESEAVAEEIRVLGRRALAIEANMARPDEIREMVRQAESFLGKIDILVNNAGLGISRDPLEVTDKEWDLQFKVNLKGYLVAAQAVAPGMIERGYGRVINMGSVVSLVGSQGLSVYTASKHAILGLTRTLALEWAASGITVNCICPGFFETPMTVPVRADDKTFRRTLAGIPMGRLGQPEELATTILFLASPASGFVTGAYLCVDGGMTAQ